MNDFYVWIWVIAFVVFTVLELANPQLITIWFALGSLVALVAQLFGLEFGVQIALFLTSSVVFLLITIPFSRKLKEKLKKAGKTNVDGLIGQDGIIVKQVSRFNQGQVKVNGQIWTCVSKTPEQELNTDDVVSVEGVEGVKLIVSKA